jgi:hypothetical protein
MDALTSGAADFTLRTNQPHTLTKQHNQPRNGRGEPESAQTQTRTISLRPDDEWLKAHGFSTNPTVAEVFGAALSGSLRFRRWAISEGHSPEAVREAVAEADQQALRERFPEIEEENQ